MSALHRIAACGVVPVVVIDDCDVAPALGDALIAGGLAIYQATSGSVQRGVQLKEDVQGKVNDAVDELQGLIEDNTR